MATLTTNEVIALLKDNVVANPTDTGELPILSTIKIKNQTYTIQGGSGGGLINQIDTVIGTQTHTQKTSTIKLEFNSDNFILSNNNIIGINKINFSQLEQDVDLILDCENVQRSYDVKTLEVNTNGDNK